MKNNKITTTENHIFGFSNKTTITENHIFCYLDDGEPFIETLIELNDGMGTQIHIPNPIKSNDDRINIAEKIIKHLKSKNKKDLVNSNKN